MYSILRSFQMYSIYLRALREHVSIEKLLLDLYLLKNFQRSSKYKTFKGILSIEALWKVFNLLKRFNRFLEMLESSLQKISAVCVPCTTFTKSSVYVKYSQGPRTTEPFCKALDLKMKFSRWSFKKAFTRFKVQWRPF